MTRYAIDAPVALALVRADAHVRTGDSLVAPAVLKSHVLSSLYGAVHAGDLERRDARRDLERLAALKVRFLSDRVSRAVAWDLAERLGWDDPGPAEYLAVASLQADVLVTEDPRLVAAASGIVTVEPVAVLLAPRS